MSLIFSIIGVLSAFVYVLSPFDLVPEAIFGVIGLLDDIVYLLGTVIFLANSYHQIIV